MSAKSRQNNYECSECGKTRWRTVKKGLKFRCRGCGNETEQSPVEAPEAEANE